MCFLRNELPAGGRIPESAAHCASWCLHGVCCQTEATVESQLQTREETSAGSNCRHHIYWCFTLCRLNSFRHFITWTEANVWSCVRLHQISWLLKKKLSAEANMWFSLSETQFRCKSDSDPVWIHIVWLDDPNWFQPVDPFWLRRCLFLMKWL